MADIFISYAREDEARGEQLAAALKGLGWSVFWDHDIPAGSTWDQYIGKELEEARAVIVLWSSASIGSHWVRDEAAEGRDREILIPVLIETGVRQPMGFRGIQTADLSRWDGATDTSVWQKFIRHVNQRIGPPGAPHPPPSVLEESAAPETKRAGQKPALEKIVSGAVGNNPPANVYLLGKIPKDKLNNAIGRYAAGVKVEKVLLLFDNTLAGGAEDGMILTDDAVYFRNPLEEGEKIPYSEIEGVRLAGFLDKHIRVNDKKLAIKIFNLAAARVLVDVILRLRDR